MISFTSNFDMSMKPFLIKFFSFIFFFVIVIEILSRVLIDPLYFGKIDDYTVKGINAKEFYLNSKTKHVDYLFIGSSRVRASINQRIVKQFAPGKTVILAGRANSTAALHYQALKRKTSLYPNFLNGATVFIEMVGSSIYHENFKENQLKIYEPIIKNSNAAPHLLLPYIGISDFIDFLKFSPNSFPIKIEMTLLFLSSTYRGIPFFHEKLKRFDFKISKSNSSNLMSDEGAIRNDKVELSRLRARDVADTLIKMQKYSNVLTKKSLDESYIAQFDSLISSNGGKLFIFKIPSHSVIDEVYRTKVEQSNKITFIEWAKERNIKIIDYLGFTFNDSDFPDYWHLSRERRDEFTTLLLTKYSRIQK